MRFLVTAGPTREYFDSVRFLSNPSSGKMGYQIAAQAAARGHHVELVSGPVDLPDPKGVRLTRVVSAAEMFEAVVSRFASCDVVLMAAAVCDYRPARRSVHKMKKRRVGFEVRLLPTPDILAHIGRVKVRQVVIGFAMEDHDHHAHAELKLKRKQCDAIVMNGLGNVGSDKAEVQVLLASEGWQKPIRGRKTSVAARLVAMAESLASERKKKAQSIICS